jgi:hypothetical protein
MLNIVMLSVDMLNVVMLSVVRPSVMVPNQNLWRHKIGQLRNCFDVCLNSNWSVLAATMEGKLTLLTFLTFQIGE